VKIAANRAFPRRAALAAAGVVALAGAAPCRLLTPNGIVSRGT
jgi:hypothetical protein